MRRSSPATATTTAADQIRRQSESNNKSHHQECLRRSLDDSLRPFQRQQEPLALKVNQFFEDVDMTNVKGQRLGITSPRLVALPEVDRSLTLEVSKNEAPDILAALLRDKIDQKYSQYVQIYTDASKDPSRKVGTGCYIRSFVSSPDIEMEARLTDDVGVQTGEMVTIKMALENVCQLRLRHTDDTQSSRIR